MERHNNDTIAAVATGQGGAIAIIRLSGSDAVSVAGRIFRPRSGKPLAEAAGYSVHFGDIAAPDGELIDEVLVTVFRAPNSYTGEDSVEISYHASTYVGQRIMELLVAAGARAAGPGEFTVRAFMAGKMDLSQAEAVADLIASADRAQHTLALSQMRGGYSSELAALRDELVSLAALLELELDFSEEDVQFADRAHLSDLAGRISAEINRLVASFSLGNVIKEGVPVAIVGRPNAGKSTLLNALVKDDRAMVSDIAGTTRDRIEERVNIDGVTYRFIDTAGLRATDDALEQMGIDRTLDAVAKAYIVLLVADSGETSAADIAGQAADLGLRDGQRLCVVLNKADKLPGSEISLLPGAAGEGLGTAFSVGADSSFDGGKGFDSVFLSAKTGRGVDSLTDWLRGNVNTDSLYEGAAVVSNTRHYEALTRAAEAIRTVSTGLGSPPLPHALPIAAQGNALFPDLLSAEDPGGVLFPDGASGIDGERLSSDLQTGEVLSSDLLAEDVREVLHYLGEITGEITTDEILGTIFSKFCIGK